MNVYIYDEYLSRGKYNRALNKVEIRLTDLGLNGKIIRLGAIKNIKSTLENEIRLGAKTLVAVGNNQTVNQIIGAIIDTDIYGDFQKNTLLGIIPIGDDNSIAESFGIKDPEEACNILLARRIKKIDIGIADKFYFLNDARIQSLGTNLELNGFSMEISEKGEVKIINLLGDLKSGLKANPHDGRLEIYINTRRNDWSYFSASDIKLKNSENKLILDGVVEVETPVTLGVVRERLNIIVGKDRSFE